MSEEEKLFILNKALPDLIGTELSKSGFFMLTGYDENILYEVTFKRVSEPDKWEIDTIRLWN